MKKIKICIIGMGEFSDFFVPLFKSHPDVEEVSIADIDKHRCELAAKKHNIKRIFTSLDDVLKSGKDIDSIALFTQRQLHGSMVIDALNAGKHIFSAVPISTSIEEAHKIIELVKQTRLIYMAAETCYYFPCAIYCRNLYNEGKIGKFVYGESQYYHDMSVFYPAFSRSGGPDWKRIAGIPVGSPFRPQGLVQIFLHCLHLLGAVYFKTGFPARRAWYSWKSQHRRAD